MSLTKKIIIGYHVIWAGVFIWKYDELMAFYQDYFALVLRFFNAQ